MLTEAQLEERLDHITGSDAASILRLSPYTNIIDLCMYKRRLKVAPDISDSPFIKKGIYLEDGIARWFEDETGIKVEKDTRFLKHKEHPVLAANIDRRIVGQNALLEIKTASSSNGWGAQGEFLIPNHYLCQVAHYAMVCDVDVVYVAVLILGHDFRWYVYERNKRFEAHLMKEELEFWKHIENETMPEPQSSQEILSLLQNMCCEGIVNANLKIVHAIESIVNQKSQIKTIQEKIEAAEEAVKVYMYDKDMLLDLNGQPLATWKKSKSKKIFDSKRFKKDNPELYDMYIKEVDGSRRFLIK